MTTTPGSALVGPLPTIRFHDGTKQAYTVPRSTLDPRYSACVDHHRACDCREAMLAEDKAEYRSMLNGAEKAAVDVLRGHATHAYTSDGEIDYARRCQCTGCQIARVAFLRSWADQEDAGTPVHRPAGWVAPR